MYKRNVFLLLLAAGTVSPCWLMFQPELSSCHARTSGGTGMSDKKFRGWSSVLTTECFQTHPVPVLLWHHFLLPWWETARDQSHHPLFCTVSHQPANQISGHVTRKKKCLEYDTSNWTQNECKFIDFCTGDEFVPIGQYFLHLNANILGKLAKVGTSRMIKRESGTEKKINSFVSSNGRIAQ